ncbi:related to MCH1 Monocarboxylate Permease Homologue, not transporting monocarboxylate [Cephalotrichum gorgonifer]|uniref:Related to MCH1 Monocarboxylate Permease Homologue, not transporting monocarboxylate n=1 Tax=Cephalotrichum gorgonifer TaxID=2041049 RepID=A0AAE8N400_9PEZI|nr:related to MCH1 Monocarboxylate Permease Homologue, not transporting monocarboxylate [Cephalotrichum gorgonifer]
MRDQQMYRVRIAVSVAATAVSLACGTNYVYSAWAPQFADRLQLSSTSSNLIGLGGNMGMYTLGFPVGLLIDSRGPRIAVVIGMLLLALGYFPLHEAYELGAGAVPILCLFSFLTGLGGCMAFSAAMKTSALNWPHHRGTATAFPVAAFGLSAFFFSSVGAILFPGDTSGFLMLLACGTSGLILISLFFLRVLPHPHRTVSTAAHRRKLSDEGAGAAAHPNLLQPEPGTSFHTAAPVASSSDSYREDVGDIHHDPESSALLGTPDEALASETSSVSSLPGEIPVQSSVDMDRSHRVDIRGLGLLPVPRFWELFALLALLSGVGLMTINNIGNDVKALWRYYDDSVDEAFVIKNQQLHVSILSLCSFTGRLLSGVGSDFLVKVMRANRIWCLVAASLVFSLAQLFAIFVTNPHFLGFVSGLTGLAYGCLFGVFPSIVAETFGIHGLSQNWGIITLAPAISGNVFNLFYGKIYDSHSTPAPGGHSVCIDGVVCYRSAYLTTLAASLLGLTLSLWVIRRERLELISENDRSYDED